MSYDDGFDAFPLIPQDVWDSGGGSAVNIFLSTKHSTGFEFSKKIQPGDRVKLDDVRKRGDSTKLVERGCYF